MRVFKLVVVILYLCFFGCKSDSDSKHQNSIVQETGINSELNFPKSVGFVNDFEQIFSKEQRQTLEKRLAEYEKQTTREIVIITVESIEPYNDIQFYGTKISNAWDVGKKESNNGLTIVLSKSLHQVSINTGLGTEKILTDFICKTVIDSIMIPEFKNNNYYSGIDKGITELTTKWN